MNPPSLIRLKIWEQKNQAHQSHTVITAPTPLINVTLPQHTVRLAKFLHFQLNLTNLQPRSFPGHLSLQASHRSFAPLRATKAGRRHFYFDFLWRRQPGLNSLYPRKSAIGALCADVDLANTFLCGLSDLDHPINTLGIWYRWQSVRPSLFTVIVLLLLLLFDSTTIYTRQIPISLCLNHDHRVDSVDNLAVASDMVLESILGGFLRW